MINLYFKNRGGTQLAGVLHKPKKNTRTCIILCHGLRADKDEKGRFTLIADKLVKRGFAVFRFDFSGRGKSKGRSVDVSISSELEDLDAAYKFLVDKGYDRFGILASSFSGGSVSFFVPKHQDKIRALAFWYPMVNFSYFLKEWRVGSPGRAELLREGYFIRKGFRTGKKMVDETARLKPWKELKKVKIPIIFIHGDKDLQVPFKYSVKYSRMFKARLARIHLGDHGFHNKKHLNEAVKATVTFFSKNLPNPQVSSR